MKSRLPRFSVMADNASAEVGQQGTVTPKEGSAAPIETVPVEGGPRAGGDAPRGSLSSDPNDSSANSLTDDSSMGAERITGVSVRITSLQV